MKKLQTWVIAAAMLLCIGGLTACGTNTITENAATENRETAADSAADQMGALEGETDEYGNRITATTETDGILGDGVSENGSVLGDVADDIGEAGKDVIDGAENAVDDITDGVSEEPTEVLP